MSATIPAEQTGQEAHTHGDHHGAEVNYLNYDADQPLGTRIWNWLSTVDHKRIALLYAWSLAFFFLIGGLLALAIRAELLTPEIDLLGEGAEGKDNYNQVFTLHGAIMVFLFLVPAIPGILGNFVLPLHLGAKDVAFPRLNLASWYVYIAGAVLAIGAIVIGNVDTGWTFYTPYSSTVAGNAVLFMTMSVFVGGFASILTGLNFIVTIHKMRAPGLTWNRLPLFVWAMYATSIVQILATPVIGITMILLFLERVLGIGIFDPALGGDPVLFQHFFWFYSHPAVYIMILPGFGIISELMATFSRQRVFGYKAIALSSVAIAMLGFLVWGHHMFVAGQSAVAAIVFSLITYLIGIPSGVKVFNWIATMYRGSVWLQTPMLYALSFLFLFTIGGLTGIMVGVLAVDVHLHDTYYVVGHFHYVMMGGQVIALLGGLHYWWPKMTGKMYNETAAKIACGLVFVGFNLTFFVHLILGSQGMPRRYATYLPEYQLLHQISTVGSWVLAAGLFTVLGYGIHSMLRGKKAPQNPWAAPTLEWTHCTSPPDPHNFHHTPIVTRGAYDFHLANELFGEPETGDLPPAGDGHGDRLGDGAPSATPEVRIGRPAGKKA